VTVQIRPHRPEYKERVLYAPVESADGGDEAPRGRWRRRLLLGGMAVFVLLVAAAGAFLFWASKVQLPPPVPPAQTSFVYDTKGNLLVELRAEQDRIVVPFSEVPKPLVDAVLAREDRRFYEHSGIDLQGTLRAAWADLRDQPLQGGSTIPQQYIKNVYLSSERTVTRKVREAVMAVKLEQRYSKDEILAMYLNTVYFGRGTYGVEAAARSYFGVSTSRLDTGQSAFLAGLISSPATADPVEHPEEGLRRRNATLRAMVETGALDATSAASVEATPLVVNPKPERKTAVTAGGSAYFAEYVRRQLVSQFGEDVVYRGGLRVTTTLDPDMQSSAEGAAHDVLDREDDPDVALVTLDADGRVRAMVGGDDYAASQVNLAVGREGGGTGRQPGSTFKAIVLATALDKGIGLDSRWSAPSKISIPLPGGELWEVSNAGDAEGGGTVSLREATAGSVNTVFAQVIMEVGADEVVAMAKRLGVDSPLPPVPSIALGSGEVSPLEMAHVDIVLANRGEDPGVHLFEEVTASDGGVKYHFSPSRKRLLQEDVADGVTAALRGVVDHGTGTAARLKGVQVAGKTGTTQDFGDAWFVGYTPTHATAVWVGYKEGRSRSMASVHGRRVFGGTFPAEIWRVHMTRVMETVEDPGTFVDPPGATEDRPAQSSGHGSGRRSGGGGSSHSPPSRQPTDPSGSKTDSAPADPGSNGDTTKGGGAEKPGAGGGDSGGGGTGGGTAGGGGPAGGGAGTGGGTGG